MSQEAGHYESIMEQYNALSEEDKNAVKNELNECGDGFGDDFFDSRSSAGLAWADLEASDKGKVAAYIDENLLHEESGEGK